MLAVGGPTSGLRDLCEGESDNSGQFYCLLASLWDKLSAVTSPSSQESIRLSNVKLGLRFLVVYNERVHDLLRLRGEPKVNDGNKRVSVQGCEVYEVHNIYEMGLILQEALTQKAIVYSESIFIVEGELTFTLCTNS